MKFILQEDHTDEESYAFFKFPESPDGVPLLLTSDGILRYFSDNKVINSAFSAVFASVCGDRFLHPEMHSLRINPNYFIKSGDNNWGMISSILHATLPECLIAQMVKKASKHIDIQKLMIPLWKCLDSDEVFSIHFDQIVRKWALLLTTNDELFAYKSDQQLLPIIPHTRSRQWLPVKHLEDFKVFKIFEPLGMPVLNQNVVKLNLCEQICPRISQVQQMLTNFVYLNEQSGLHSLMMNDSCEEQIAALFSYFGRIHFARDPDSLSKIRSLPLFKDIRGRFCTLNGDTYIWPSYAIPLDAGREKWMEQTSTVFISPSGDWNKLGDASALRLKEVSPLLVYNKFIFPFFNLLDNDERMTHLKHIRDTECLFDQAWYKKTGKEVDRCCIEFISALQSLPCLLKNGELQPITAFCDPNKPIFGLFLTGDSFPPQNLTDDTKWLHFFRKLGLRTKATMEEFISFCERIAEGKQRNIEESSCALMEYVFENSCWHDKVEFLNKLSNIPFVCANRLEDLNWLVPVAHVDSTIQQGSKTFHLTKLCKSASAEVKNLIWAVKPIVTLPYGKLSPSEKECKVEQFYRYIKVVRKPSLEDIVKNIKLISESRFTNFELFDHSIKDCIPLKRREGLLFSVVVECFEYLKDNNCTKEDLSCLQNTPCIPVISSGFSTQSVLVTVLVTALQVVGSTDSEGTIKKLVPFLNPLPDDLYSVLPGVLSKLGVTTEIRYGNLRNALTTIHHNIEQPLDPNSVAVLKLILKHLYSVEVPPATREPLYLPSEKEVLVESTKLLHDDHGRYRRGQFNTSGLAYSFMSLFTSTNQERNEYGFTLKEFIQHLPPAIRPLSLSSHCSEQLSSGCTLQERMTDLTTRLKQAFGFQDFAKVIQMILAGSVQTDVCERFTENLSDFCNSVKVYSVLNLKVDIYLTLIDPPVNIGSANVDFFLQYNSKVNLLFYVST